MDECTLKEYCDKDCKSCILAKEIKDIAEVNEAIENIKKAIIEAFAPLAECVTNVTKFICGMWDAIKNAHPNKRVVHLAQKAKKARTKKKNTNRIVKDILREGENKNNGRN